MRQERGLKLSLKTGCLGVDGEIQGCRMEERQVSSASFVHHYFVGHRGEHGVFASDSEGGEDLARYHPTFLTVPVKRRGETDLSPASHPWFLLGVKHPPNPGSVIGRLRTRM